MLAFATLMVCGLVGGIMYDLYEKLPWYMILTCSFILIAYPIFVIVSILSMPKTVLLEDRIKQTSYFINIELLYADITKHEASRHMSKIYSVGQYYCLYNNAGLTIAIPKKLYKNEKALIQELEKRTGFKF